MTSLVDLATYNKALADKQKIAITLKKLQEASNSALIEFNMLKQQHFDLQSEVETLRETVNATTKQKSHLESQLSHSEYLLKRITKVAKAAIKEFTELKQRYVDEYERRRHADQMLYELQRKMDGSQLAAVPSAKSKNDISRVKPRTALSVNDRDNNLEKELAGVKVQLHDTILEFQKFRDLALTNQADLENKFKNEVKRFSTLRIEKLPATSANPPKSNTNNADSLKTRPEKEDYQKHSIPKSLAQDIQKGKQLKLTSLASPSDSLTSNSTLDRAAKHLTVYANGGFGQLGALLSKSNDIIKSPSMQNLFLESSKKGNTDPDPYSLEIASKLLQSSQESRSMLERNSTRVFEVAGLPQLQGALTNSKSRENISTPSKFSSLGVSREDFSPLPPPPLTPNTMSSHLQSPMKTPREHRPESALTLVNPPSDVDTPRLLSAVDETFTDRHQVPFVPGHIGADGAKRSLTRESLKEIQSVFEELESNLEDTSF